MAITNGKVVHECPPGVLAATYAHLKPSFWEKLSRLATHWAGSTFAFVLMLGIILTWLLTGPIFGFSDTWQLVINTSTSVVTFLMVFLIQRSQNRESEAMQIKLNEILFALHHARNRLINVEDEAEKEVEELHESFNHLEEISVRDRHSQRRQRSSHNQRQPD